MTDQQELDLSRGWARLWLAVRTALGALLGLALLAIGCVALFGVNSGLCLFFCGFLLGGGSAAFLAWWTVTEVVPELARNHPDLEVLVLLGIVGVFCVGMWVIVGLNFAGLMT